MDRDVALELIDRYTESIWNKHDYTVADTIFSQDFIDHDALPGQGDGYAGYLDMVSSLHAIYPHLEMHNDDIYLDPDQSVAVVRWSAEGSSQNSIFGLLAGKKPARMKGIDVFRIKNDRISEHWGEFDALGFFR